MAGNHLAHPLLVILRRIGVTVASSLIVLSAHGQDSVGGVTSSPAVVEMLTYLLGTAGALIALVTGIFVFVLVRRAREQRDREALDEARFESETLATLQPYEALAKGPGSASNDMTAPTAPVLDIVRDPSVPPAPADGQVEDYDIMQAVLLQLRRANLLEGYETYLELHGQPKGMAAVRLRGGKKALVLPRLESEGFTTHQLRRYDYIICAGGSGRPVLIQPLAEYIASRFSM